MIGWAVPRRRRRALTTGIVLAALLAIGCWPLAPALPRAHPHPATGYDESLARFRALLAAEPGGLTAACEPRLLTHGHRTARVMVLLHGFTNCPQQFAAFASRCHERGDNVVLARLPEHGLRDRRAPTLGRVTAAAVTRATDQAIDLAAGMGDTVVVVGLSVGGVAAAWAGEQRPEVARAGMIAPMFGLGHMPEPVSRGLARWWQWMPDGFRWWDPRLRERLVGPPYCYWGWSTRGLAAMLQLAFAVRAHAEFHVPHAEMVMVLNANDEAVDNALALGVTRVWARHAPGRVRRWEFPADLELGHDLIDPEQPYQRIDLVYPVLERLTAGDGIPVRPR
jgi:alpha-beta hydrolase superfamily lysophospholipase